MRRYLIVAFILAFAYTAAGRDVSRRADFHLKRHEFSLGGAFYPGRYAFGYDFDFIPRKYSYVSPTSISDIYLDGSTYNKEKVTNSWTISYTYNFSRLFALQAGVSYEGGWSECYRKSEDVMVSSISSQYLTPMLTARFSWLNRRFVRMYSSFGAGIAVSLSDTHFTTSDDKTYERQNTYMSLQLAPVGISVGGSFFGFIEVGIGTVYVGGCFGLGYRF